MSGGPSLRERVTERLLQHAEQGLVRVNVELAGEQVTLSVRGGRLRSTCTCGLDGCEHLEAALPLFVDGALPASSVEPRTRSARPDALPDLDPLLDAFDALCLATARAGVAHRDSPSITQALEQLLAVAPQPVPLSIARWVGRFQAALEACDEVACARLLDGALRWSAQQRADPTSREALAARRAWLGSSGGQALASLADVTLIEVAREWLAGIDRASIERRYLIDLASGDGFVEERRRGELDISVGPCPRVTHVAFAELDADLRPQRVRLLQYTLSLQLAESVWPRMLELAEKEIAGLRVRFVKELETSPGLAEPLALFAPAELDEGVEGGLRDARGERLALRGEHGVSGAELLRGVSRGGDLVCVVGRLLAGAQGLALRPLSAIVRRGAWYELRRVT